MESPSIVYHCTTKDSLEAILVEGLNPEKSKSSLRAVFLSDCQFLANGYTQQRQELEHVLLSIDFAALDPALLGPDNCELQDWLDEQDEEHVELTGVTHWSEASWQQSLEWCNQVAYSGVIPPSAIRIVEEVAPVQMPGPGMGM